MTDLAEYGDVFRQTREAQELSLEDIERRTRIRLKHLEAIERGDFAAIPSSVQLRGFIRNYAQALGLDPDYMLAEYEQAQRGGRRRRRKKSQSSPPEAKPVVYPPTTPPSSNLSSARATGTMPAVSPPPMVAPMPNNRRNRTAVRTVLAVVIAATFSLVVIIGILWGVNSITSSEDDEPTATEQPLVIDPILDGDVQSPLIDRTPSLTPTNPPPSPQPTLPPSDELFVVVTALSRVWLQITVDGVVEFEGHMPPEQGTLYTAQDSLTIKTFNADRLRVEVNNREVSLGPPNQEVEQTFTLEGQVTPTFEPNSATDEETSPAAGVTFSPTSVAFDITATVTDTATIPSSIPAQQQTESALLQATLSFEPTSIDSSATSAASAASVASATPTTAGIIIASPTPQGGIASATAVIPTSTTGSGGSIIISPTPLPTLPNATSTPALPTATFTLTPTPMATLTPTNFLPPRHTRTPTPDK